MNTAMEYKKECLKVYKKQHTVDQNGRVRRGPAVANPLGKPPEGADAIVTTVRATRALSVTWSAWERRAQFCSVEAVSIVSISNASF